MPCSSTAAASRSETSAGSCTSPAAGTAASCACAPPAIAQPTRWPAATPVTPSPTAATRPAASAHSTNGGRVGSAPVRQLALATGEVVEPDQADHLGLQPGLLADLADDRLVGQLFRIDVRAGQPPAPVSMILLDQQHATFRIPDDRRRGPRYVVHNRT